MRKTKSVTITAEGRDKGKTYFLTEMNPKKSEKWAARVILALIHSGADIPDDAAKGGMAGIASMGSKGVMALLSGARWEDIEPLLDEMLECVKCQPNKNDTTVLVDLLPEEAGADQIEEIGTLFTLRKEVLELHLGFSLAEKLSSLEAKGKDQSTNT